MPSIKRRRKIVDRVIGETEALAALEVYAYIERKKSQGLFEITYKHDKPIVEFEETYGHSHEKTIEEMWKLKDYIFPKNRSSSPINEIYENYAKCVADRVPTKWSLGNNQFDISNGEWVFKGYVYDVKGLYSDDQIKLLILEDFDRERMYFEKLKVKFNEAPSQDSSYERPRIPESVRIEVWRRDGGKCARCGSREKLEYDHIVPISKGGSNTARNIELLCEKCNRSKSNNVV
jgi:hypothetical protein